MQKVDRAVLKPHEVVRAYERPQIVSREKLEVIAAVCSPGKGPAQPGDCLLNTNS